MRKAGVRGGLLLLALLPAACDGRVLDPEKNPMTWTPEGVNNQNIAAMVANKQDLALGHGEAGSDGQQAAQAVHRWRTAPPTPFGGASSSGGDTSGGGAGSGSGGGGTGGGAT